MNHIIAKKIPFLRSKLSQFTSAALCASLMACNTDTFVKPDDSAMFTKLFGGANNDTGLSLEETKDGYLIIGTTNSKTAGGSDILLIKVDKNGNEIWEKRYGDQRNQGGNDIALTPEGDILVLGFTNQKHKNESYTDDILLMKVSPQGDSLTSQTYEYENNEKGISIITYNDGNLLLIGQDENDILTLKTEPDGKIITDKPYGNIEDIDRVGSGVVNPNGELVLCNTVIDNFDNGDFKKDVSIIFFSETGNINSKGGIYGDKEKDDYGNDVQITPGGYITTGKSGKNVYLLKTDSRGKKLWFKTYEKAGEQEGESVSTSFDGGFIVTGYTKSDEVNAQEDIYLFKTDNEGNLLWSNTFGGDYKDNGILVKEASDRGIIIIGTSHIANNDVFTLIKTDSDGNALGDGKIK